MSWIFCACAVIAFVWMGLFFLWGKGFLTFIHAERDAASSLCLGYLILQVVYQIFYFPFFLTRGSYRSLSYIWMGVVAIGSVLLILYLRKHPSKGKEKIRGREIVGVVIAGVLVFALAIYISLHVPFYGADTVGYISAMNEAYYNDIMWIAGGNLFQYQVHHGLNSFFHFFTMSSLLTEIKPYYISLFTVRIIGIILFSLILYRIGVIVFKKVDSLICWPAIALAVICPVLLMFWGSNYTAEFFYWRINEAKGFCQFVLLPIGFSVFLEMFRSADRKPVWKKQFLVALAAVAVSSSSMTAYIFLLLMGTMALLAYDKLKKGWWTIGKAVICSLPNLAYLLFYVLVGKGTIVL